MPNPRGLRLGLRLWRRRGRSVVSWRRNLRRRSVYRILYHRDLLPEAAIGNQEANEKPQAHQQHHRPEVRRVW